MKILHIVQSLDPAWGGIARVVPMLAARLAGAGDDCRIATLAGGRYGSAPAVPGVEVLTFEAPDASRLGRSPGFDATVDELVRDADVVHLHGLWTGQNWSAGRTARKLGRPYVMTPHSMMMPWAWHFRRWKKLLAGWVFEHRNLRNAACLHALAEGEAQAIRALGFNDRIVMLPNGLELAEFEHPPPAAELESRYPRWSGKRLLLVLGRISPQKGIFAGMKACFDLFAAAKDWHLVIAGPDPMGMRPAIEAAVGRKGAADRVTFTGMLQRDEVRAILSRASLLLQPSRSEGLSMSILEALASGLPVLISTACNMPEVEACGAGRVVAPNQRDIASALRELLSLPEEVFRQMGEAARALAREKYDWSVVVPGYREMYRRIAAGR